MSQFSDVIESIGVIQRFDEAIKAEKEGRWAGKQYGDIPVLGGALRPVAAAANAVGLGLEGLGTTGKAIAGEVALPIAYAQRAYDESGLPGANANPNVSETARQITSVGLGEALRHPGRSVDALRESKDSPTAWLGGILEMASDPTNLLPLAPAKYINRAKAAKLAGLAKPAVKLSDDLGAGRAAEFAQQLERRNFYDDLLGQEAARVDEVAGSKQQLTDLETQLQAISDELTGKRFEKKEFSAYYKEAKAAQHEALKGTTFDKPFPEGIDPQTNLPIVRPENVEIRARNAAKAAKVKEEALARFPGGPKPEQTYGQYLDEPNQAIYRLEAKQREMARLYADVKKRAPQPIRYGENGVPLGQDKNLLRVGGVNALFNADEAARAANMPLTSADEAAAVGLPTAPSGSPEAVAEAMDITANAQSLTPQMNPSTVGRMFDLISVAFKVGKEAQAAAVARDGVLPALRQMPGIWKGVSTETVRNIFMDEAFSRFIASHNGIRNDLITRNRGEAIARLKLGEKNPMHLLGAVSDYRAANGAKDVLGTKELDEVRKKLGVSAYDVETEGIDNLSAMQHFTGGLGLGLANPVRATTNLLTAPLGYYGAMRHAMFHVVNSVTHNASRAAAFEQAYLPRIDASAKALLARAAEEGKDVSKFTGRIFNHPFGDVYEGAFSPQEVTMWLGKRYGDEWQRLVKEADEAGFARAREVFGDYANRSKLEQAANVPFPFMSWAWRAYPRVAYAVLQHPAVVAGILQLYQADIAQAKGEGRPGYQYGTLSIDKDTPFVGLLAKVFSPEQEAEVRFNPIAMFSPLGGEALSAVGGAEDKGDQTLYQQAMDAVGLVGASPSPLLQAGAYISGQDYQSPSALSRYAPIDQAVDNAGIGFTEVPTIQGPLRGAREMVTGKKDTYDPVLTKAYELVLEETGVPISDTRNKAIAIAIKNGDSPYLQRAERIVDVGGAGRAAFNANSPVSVQVTSETTKDKREAQLGTPYSYEEIEAVKAIDPRAAALMERKNQEFLLRNPAAAVGVKPKITARDLTIARGAALREAGLR